ncbi:hypothetical protein [Candidatus Poriferisocius sp.]|uniref:hypothetical protein n=1 Tax=Candidatus Poriferisocius sp. TaxID=3101276 RepID=UPI003B02D1E4
MFYEVMGALLKAAADPVATQNAQGDDVDRFHAQRVAQMLERIGGAWPYLLDALCRENEILAEALAIDHEDSDPEHDDPLAENRRLLELAELTMATTDDADTRRRLRAALAEAAHLQRAALRAGRQAR